MEEVALAISPKTHVAVSSHQKLVGRAFLRNFHHNHTPSPLAGMRSALFVCAGFMLDLEWSTINK
jgi:hypothetical protein